MQLNRSFGLCLATGALVIGFSSYPLATYGQSRFGGWHNSGSSNNSQTSQSNQGFGQFTDQGGGVGGQMGNMATGWNTSQQQVGQYNNNGRGTNLNNLQNSNTGRNAGRADVNNDRNQRVTTHVDQVGCYYKITTPDGKVHPMCTKISGGQYLDLSTKQILGPFR